METHTHEAMDVAGVKRAGASAAPIGGIETAATRL
jgi:hypothetical protein